MTENATLIVRADASVKSYPNTLQRLAKHFWYACANSSILKLADELESRPEISVVCITDENRKPIGIIRREDLFLRLSKRFGREVMSQDTALSCVETPLVYPGEHNILHISEHLHERTAETKGAPEESEAGNGKTDSIVLVDSQGAFSGMLSLRDVASYMVELTNEDIAMASLLQERFLANADRITQLEVSVDAWWSSAKGVGGDFYFIRRISADKFFAALCDVSGKGVAAALVVSIVWGFLRAHSMQGSLQNLLASLNTAVLNSFHREKYLTGFFLVYDAGKRLLRVADMGHSHTLFLRKGQLISLKKTRVNLPLGIEEELHPAVYALSAQPGDTLLIYSDGIPEQDNPAGEEFGEQRLLALLAETVTQGKALSETLPKALEEFRQHTPQHDDMTFLMFRF